MKFFIACCFAEDLSSFKSFHYENLIYLQELYLIIYYKDIKAKICYAFEKVRFQHKYMKICFLTFLCFSINMQIGFYNKNSEKEQINDIFDKLMTK